MAGDIIDVRPHEAVVGDIKIYIITDIKPDGSEIKAWKSPNPILFLVIVLINA